MMKRLISIIILLLLIPNILFAQTLYEKKLEYRRKKTQILVRTYLKGESSRYSTHDDWSTTISPESGYSYTYSYGSDRSDRSITYKEVSNWVIIRGGVRELGDIEFLKLTGKRDEAKEVKSRMDERNKWMIIGTVTGLFGIGIGIAGSSDGTVGAITAGSIVSIIGFLISSMNLPQKHYITADYALEQSDLYNIKIKKELGLPIDFE